MTTNTIKPKSKAQEKRDEQARAIEHLRGILPPGATVHTILRHVSRSGMFRRISLVATVDGAPVDIDYWAARAMGERIDGEKPGIRVGGCGMDMGFHLVYNLACTLYPKGHTCVGKDCPSNDHSNGDRNREPHQHTGGGYALKHRWL